MKRVNCALVSHTLCALAFVFSSLVTFASDDFDWAAAAEAGGGQITITNGQTATVVDADIPAFANITKITCEGTTSRVYFKNTQPFTVNAEFAGSGGNAGEPSVIQMDAQTGKITFANKVYFADGRYITLGNADILGLFGANRSVTYGHVTVLAGCTADFKEGSQLQRECINYIYGDGTYKFACKIPSTSDAGYLSFGAPTIIFNADNLLNAGYAEVAGTTFDLNGHSQSIAYISSGSATVTSKTPAALTLNGTTASSFNFGLKGAASLVYRNTAKLTSASGISSTTGSLDIESGIVELKSSACFRSGTINVSGGELMLSAATVTGGGADVVVTGTGVLNIPSVTCSMRSLTILGNKIDLSDEVSVADLATSYPDNVKGSGAVMAPFVRYVSPTGSDSADGKTELTAYKSLMKAATVACHSGDTIIALPGVYKEEVMGAASGDGYSRVVIPAGVTLKSRDGAAVTTILGKKAATPISGYEQCGTDSARCVQMLAGAHLVGFTLTGGCPTTDGNTLVCGGSGVLAAGSDDYIVDCVITNCYSPSNYSCRYGKYLRCIVQNCRTKLTYACGVRDAYAYDSVFKNFSNNGFMDTAAAVVNCSFDSGAAQALRGTTVSIFIDNSIIVSTKIPTDNLASYRNCLFTTAPKVGSTLTDCLVTNAAAIALNSTAWTNGAASVARGFANLAKYKERLAAAGFTADEIGRGTDVHGVPRVIAGQLDAGASQYDRRSEFSDILAADGTLAVTWVDPDVAPADDGMFLPDGQALELDWQMPSTIDETTFQFAAELADGASLAVYTNGVLLTTVTTSGKVNFTGDADIALRLVATGGATVSAFKNGVKAEVRVAKGGVAVVGVEANVATYISEPLTVAVRRVYDAYERLATGFCANGEYVSFDDHPDGWTWSHTVSDVDSSILIEVVYDESLTEWYVDPVKGSDETNFGRKPTNPVKTLKAAASHATSGQTIHAAAGTYDKGVMGTENLYRVIVPEGVSLVADEGAAKTFIVGAKATPEDAWLALDGCGTNSVRGVYLSKSATLRNFTVTGGYGRCYMAYSKETGKIEPTGDYGGGILCQNDTSVAHIYDCIISNNYAWGGAGAHIGCYVRCQFLNNRSKLGYRVGFTGTPGYAINCYFAGQSSVESCQAHVTDINAAVNCTFMGSIGGIRSAGSEVKCYNCIFQSYPTTSNAGSGHFYNCLATQKPDDKQHPETWTNAVRGNVVVPAAQLALDPVTHAPAGKDLATVDSENAWNHYTNNVSSLIAEAEYMQDLNGGSRVYDARLDIGAAEYDWRGDFARCLSRRRCLGVTSASANVQTNGTSLKLPEGTLAVTWSGKIGDIVTFAARQTGEGTLSVRLGAAVLEPVSSEGGVFAYRFKLTSDVAELAFAFVGEGFVDLSGFRREIGLMFLVR